MQRHIDIKGGHNIRDIGGYTTKDGHQVKWKVVFRAGKLSRIQEKDFDQTAQLKLVSICDFRTTMEQQNAPDQWHNLEQLNRYSLPIGEGRLDKPDWIKRIVISDNPSDSYLYKANRSYVLNANSIAQYKAFFKILLDKNNYPLLYHCTAGKDRTGFATVLLLFVLGVDKSTIIKDYLLTNQYMEKFGAIELKTIAADYAIPIINFRPLLMAKEAYLQGAFDAIEEQYGSMNDFLEKALNVGQKEVEVLKVLLLEIA